MPATFTPGPNLVTIEVDNPARDDFGGLKIWMSTTSGFTPNDATNLVYNGLDLSVILTDLTAGVPHYFKYATLSEIDPADYDTSSQVAVTPLAPTVAAESIFPGNIRGSNVFAGSFATKGATLALASVAAAATLTLTNTDDFPASGSAVIQSSTASRDRDVIAYTGKTATTLTGVTGATAHSAGEVIVPLAAKTMVIDHNVGEMRFFDDRGDGVIEEMANIGKVSTSPSGTIVDDAVIAIGSYASAFERVPLHVRASKTYGIYAHRTGSPSGNQPVGFFYAQGNTAGPALWAQIDGTNSTYAMFAMTGTAGIAINGQAMGGSAKGVQGTTTGNSTTWGVRGSATTGTGVLAENTGAGVPLKIVASPEPTTSLAAGAMYVSDTSGEIFAHDGSAWRQLLRTSDDIVVDSVTVNRVTGGNATSRAGFFDLEISDTQPLTANRNYYGAQNIIRTAQANLSGFTATLYGAYNLANVGVSAGTKGTATTVYGSYNYALAWGASVGTIPDMYGAYCYASNTIDSAAAVTEMRGVYARVNHDAPKTGTSAYGVDALVDIGAGTFTNVYGYRAIIQGAGTMTHKWGIHVTGSDKNKLAGYLETDGIKFPATPVVPVDVNTLYDYETGTFTPRIDGTTAAGTGTYSNQTGRYTKVGNRVFGQLVVTWTAHTGTGNIEIAGMPFTHTAGVHTPVSIYIQNVPITAGSTVQGFVNAGAAFITVNQVTAAGAVSAVPMDPAGTFRVGFQYEAT